MEDKELLEAIGQMIAPIREDLTVVKEDLAYHLCTMQCDDADYIQMRNSILDFANQFHRVQECGIQEPINLPEKE